MTDDTYRVRIASELFGSLPRALGSYFRVYDNLIARSDVCVLQIEEPEFEHTNPITHDDILLAAEILRSNPTLNLDQASEQLGLRRSTSCSTRQLKLAILVSVRAMFMLDCTAQRSGWESRERFVDFASRCFPKAATISVAAKKAMEDQKSMKAWKLRARLKLSFKGTDNLAHHLLLDPLHPEGPTLYLFHYAAFLKAQLDRLKRENFQKEDGILTCLGMHVAAISCSPSFRSPYCCPSVSTQLTLSSGCLPPRLLAETLHSIQAILFHFDDRRSGRILERLITKDGFDDHCAQAEGYKIFDGADNFEYRYWGERLAALHNFTRERPPRNRFERWMKWQSSERNAFAVALAALLISIVVGLLSLVVAGLQTWVAWKAWKQPVSNDDETIQILHEVANLLREQLRG